MWQPAIFTPPASIAVMVPQLSGAVDTLDATLSSGAGSLGGLGLPGGASGGSSVGELREQASELLSSPAAYLAITPYHYGIGQWRGDHAYLTPQGAINAVADRLGDAALPAGVTDLVLLVMAAPAPGQLAAALALFNRVFPILELQQAERRASALASLEEDKLKIPDAPAYPAWGKASPERDATGLATSRAVGAQLAVAEGLAAAQASPVERLASFAAKVSAAMRQRQADLDALMAGMAGTDSGWHGVYLEGAGPDLARQLREAAPPLDAAYKCSVAVGWFGAVGQVAYYKEAFGL